MIPLLRRTVAAAALLAGALVAPTALAYQRFCATEDSLCFGNRELGSTAASVTISSCGDEAWTFTAVSPPAATGGAFRVDSSCRIEMTLAPGEGCSVEVTFAPAVAGQITTSSPPSPRKRR